MRDEILNGWSRESLGKTRNPKAEKEGVEAKYMCELHNKIQRVF